MRARLTSSTSVFSFFNRTAKGDSKALAMADELRYMSLYEFAWKFYVNRGRLCRSQKPVCIMVTPAFSADCANVSHDRHEAYARTAVVAYWRLMPTQKRHEAIMEHQYLRAEDLATTDRRTWGTTEFAAPMAFPRCPRLGAAVRREEGPCW